MDRATRQAIARIDISAGGTSLSRGTGTLVGPGLLLTALHVVANRATDPPTFLGAITVSFPAGTVPATVAEGRWDRRDDWVILHCTPPPGTTALPLGSVDVPGLEWETYGFPDANPRDGMVQSGSIENHQGDLDGSPAFQLFSLQAAAGRGAPVKGLSGGPVLIDGAVVGVLRTALMREGETVAGTLYATPASAPAERCPDLFPTVDPYRGLPGFSHRPLPAEPYRYLARYTSADAEVFFGRGREIRDLYVRLTTDGSERVLTLYGQSGVGKSSMLDAGLLPRLEGSCRVLYVRRDPSATLSDTVAAMLTAGTTGTRATADLGANWRAAEAALGQPLILIVDQVEEIYTRPRPEGEGELSTLLAALSLVLGGDRAIRGRLVLSFRKEWFPEIQKTLEDGGIAYSKVFLARLERDAVVETIVGLCATDRLRKQYGLRLERGLADAIADELSADRDSPMAPTLQVLLTRMWRHAVEDNRSAPSFTRALYAYLRREGMLLGDFIDQQTAALHALHPGLVDSGLALDLLASHATPLLTARERTKQEIESNYSHHPGEIGPLLQDCQDLFLLVDAAGDQAASGTVTRLAHDTLAPIVRERFDRSSLPGSRARRLIESRAVEWSGGSDGDTLDEVDLALVQRGLTGMRVLTLDEQRLVAASDVEARRLARRRRAVSMVLVTAALAVAASAAVAAVLWQREVSGRLRSEAHRDASAVGDWLALEPINALLLAVRAAGTSAKVNDEPPADLEHALNLALSWVREIDRRSVTGAPLAVGPAGVVVTFFSMRAYPELQEGVYQVWDAAGQKSATLPLHGLGDDVVAAISPDGRRLAVTGGVGVAVVTLDGQLVSAADLENPLQLPGVTAIAFTPAGERLIAGYQDGALRVLDLRGQPIGEAWRPVLQAVPEDVFPKAQRTFVKRFGGDIRAVAAITTAADRAGNIVIITGGADGAVRRWSQDGRQIGDAMIGHQNSVTAVDAAFDGDDIIIASASDDSTVRLWNARGLQIGGPMVHESPVRIVTFSPSGAILATANFQGNLRLITNLVRRQGADLEPGARPVIQLQGNESGPDPLLRFLDGDRRLIAVDGSGRVRTFDATLDRNEVLPRPGDGTLHSHVAMHPTGEALILAGDTTDWWTPTASRRVGGDRTIVAAAFNETGTQAALGRHDGAVELLDGTGRSLRILPALDADPESRPGTQSLAFSRDGTLLALGHFDGRVSLWDVSGQRRFVVAHPDLVGSVAGLAVLPSADRVYASGFGPRVFAWTLAGQPLPNFNLVLPSRITALVATSAGDGFYAGLSNGELHRFTASGEAAGLPAKQIGEIRDIVPAAGGRRLFTSTEHGIGVWNAQMLEHVTTIRTPARVMSLAASQDGVRLVAALADGTVRRWRLDWRDWLSTACARLAGHVVFRDPGAQEGEQQTFAEDAKRICSSGKD